MLIFLLQKSLVRFRWCKLFFFLLWGEYWNIICLLEPYGMGIYCSIRYTKEKRGLHIKETPILYIYYRWMNSKDIYIFGVENITFSILYNEFYGSEIF